MDFATAVKQTHAAVRACDASALAASLGRLGSGMDVNNLTDHGERLLTKAAGAGFGVGVTVLLEHGADPNLASDSNEHRGLLPMAFVLRGGHPTATTLDICRQLAERGGDLERTHELPGACLPFP